VRAPRRRLSLVPGVHRATHRIGLWLEGASPPLGVTQGEAHLLAHLAEEGPSAVGALHRAFAHKRSSLTSFLDRLEARGYVERGPNPSDRRSFLVSLTAEGGAAAARVHRRLEALETAALQRHGARELQAFRAVLRALERAAVEPEAPAARRRRSPPP